MEKVYELNGSYIYYVESLSSFGNNFYLRIDKKSNSIDFSFERDFKDILGSMNFNISTVFPEVHGITRPDLVMSAGQAYKALQKNDFPKSLSVCY